MARWGSMAIQAAAAVPFVVVIPALCAFLDRFDEEKEFTVGYFVSAEKRQDA